MWAGLPARKLRDLKEGEDKMALIGSAHYVEEADHHMRALRDHALRPAAPAGDQAIEC